MNGGGACEPVVLLMQAVTGTSDRVLNAAPCASHPSLGLNDLYL